VSSTLNPGLDFWEEQVQAGTTYNLDKNRLWNASLLSTWEFNQGKQRGDLKPGPMATFEYSFGRRFPNGGINVGVAGFAYQKLSADTGSAVKPPVRRNLDRGSALAPSSSSSTRNITLRSMCGMNRSSECNRALAEALW
jgi:hypothetical protein